MSLNFFANKKSGLPTKRTQWGILISNEKEMCFTFASENKHPG